MASTCYKNASEIVARLKAPSNGAINSVKYFFVSVELNMSSGVVCMITVTQK